MRHKHADLIYANIHKFIYDDGELLWSDNFHHRAKKGGVAGSIDTHGYRHVRINGTNVRVHRIIWAMHNKSIPEQIDHINRDRADNRIENLRASNNMLNQHNASKRKDNISGCTGVIKKNGKWQSRISFNKKRIHLGTFESFDQAKTAYLIAKEKYHVQAA
jgi:hypothetical protein